MWINLISELETSWFVNKLINDIKEDCGMKLMLLVNSIDRDKNQWGYSLCLNMWRYELMFIRPKLKEKKDEGLMSKKERIRLK